MNDKRRILVIGAVVFAVTLSVGIVVTSAMFEWSNDKYVNSLMRQVPFVEGGVSHPWYIAPMQGYRVQLYNGSEYLVNSDHWDGCEHNPDQGHLIGIGYTNKTAYDERVKLDQDPMTRNYIATFQTISWVNATMVKTVIFEAWA